MILEVAIVTPVLNDWVSFSRLLTDVSRLEGIGDVRFHVVAVNDGSSVDFEFPDFPDWAILYLDVVEHIADDAAELARATRHLKPGGHLIVLVPAHQFLYRPFDAAIGHFRRYSRARLRHVGSGAGQLERLRSLDSVGLFASLANRLLLRAASPTSELIRLWDRLMVPMSRVVDRLTGYRTGKSILGVWTSP